MCIRDRSTDTGRSKLDCAMRVAVMTIWVRGAVDAVLAASAVVGATAADWASSAAAVAPDEIASARARKPEIELINPLKINLLRDN